MAQNYQDVLVKLDTVLNQLQETYKENSTPLVGQSLNLSNMLSEMSNRLIFLANTLDESIEAFGFENTD